MGSLLLIVSSSYLYILYAYVGAVCPRSLELSESQFPTIVTVLQSSDYS